MLARQIQLNDLHMLFNYDAPQRHNGNWITKILCQLKTWQAVVPGAVMREDVIGRDIVRITNTQEWWRRAWQDKVTLVTYVGQEPSLALCLCWSSRPSPVCLAICLAWQGFVWSRWACKLLSIPIQPRLINVLANAYLCTVSTACLRGNFPHPSATFL